METLIDFGFVRGVITALVFAAFLGMVFWAYSGRRQRDFDAASQMPLEEDRRADAGLTRGDVS